MSAQFLEKEHEQYLERLRDLATDAAVKLKHDGHDALANSLLLHVGYAIGLVLKLEGELDRLINWRPDPPGGRVS